MTSPFLGSPENPPSPHVTLCHLFEVPPLSPLHCHHHRTTHRPLGHHHLSPPQDTSHVTCFFKKVDILYGQPLNILVNYFLAKWFTFYFVIIGIKTLNCLPIPIYFCSLMTSPFSDTPLPPVTFWSPFWRYPPSPLFCDVIYERPLRALIGVRGWWISDL